MYKKITAISTTIIIGLGSVVFSPSAMAESNPQAITQANLEVSQYQQQLNDANKQVARIEKAINDNNQKILDTENKINASQTQIEQLKQETAAINDRIANRAEILKKRAQSLQENGGTVSYLDVLFGSSSFNDFIDRVGAVSTIVQADQDLMKQQEADKQEAEQKQAEVEKGLAGLQNMKTELEGMMAGIQEQKAQADALQSDLQTKTQEKLNERAQLQQQARDFAAQAAQAAKAALGTPAARAANSSNPNPAVNTAAINVSPAKASGSASEVISAGYKYIGNSVYAFGGGRSAYDIANGRFDCSGFVHWAFAQAGYNIGSSTDALKNQGRRVSTSEMQPGDLVFFNTYKTDGHVGIYVGGGKFIGSQNSTGVAIADMTHGYWQQTFNGRVVRILN